MILDNIIAAQQEFTKGNLTESKRICHILIKNMHDQNHNV